MRSFKTLAFTLGLLALLPAASGAQCDYPLIIQTGSVAPNVLIVLDSSGSMNETLFHPDYDPFVIYPGTFTSTKYYYVGSDGMYDPRDFKWNWPTSPSAPLVSGDCCGAYGYYNGNYLNWIYYHADDAQRAALPQETRMEVGKAAIGAVLDQAVGLNYGLMRFSGSSGGNLLEPLGSSSTDIKAAANGIKAESYTPSAETLLDALEYFSDDDGHTPVQYECQQNFIIFVTDGVPTQDYNIPGWIGDQDGDNNEPGDCLTLWPTFPNSWDCSDYMDDVSYYMANNDLVDGLDGDQNVFTYTIGFALDHPLIEDTAANGQGLYMVAWDLDSLLNSLGTVIGDIVNRVSSGAAVAVVSTESGDDNALYRGKFMPGQWRGFLEAYDLPYEEGDQPRWEAGRILKDRSPDDRVVMYNWFGDLKEFDEGEKDFFAGLLGSSEEYAADLINYIRGEDIAGWRDRDGWKLGDLVYSTPVVVGPPTRFFFDQEYQDFLRDHKNRRRHVYVGANDGMLHAFDAETGDETWAYVPWGITWDLANLTDPNYCHDSYVDLSPIVEDVYVNGSWRTILFGGLRTGGSTYFAIDVTDPYAPEPMWETWMSYIGTTYTEPAVAQTKWKPVIWSGSSPQNNGEAWASATRIDTGSMVGAVQLSAIGSTNMATAPLAYDKDLDGYHDTIYQADLSGGLWRWDVSSADPGQWAGYKIFDGDEPIQARPTVTTDEAGNTYVYFGTGKYVEAGDLMTSNQQRFYCVRDYHEELPTTLTAGDLYDQTNNIAEAAESAGWYFDLENSAAERVTEPAIVLDGVVYFTSFAPNTAMCSGGGSSWLYSVSYTNGAGVKDQDPSEADSTDNRSDTLGDGIASRPVVSLVDGSIVVQTSDARLNMRELETEPQQMIVRAWREEFETFETEETQGVEGQ